MSAPPDNIPVNCKLKPPNFKYFKRQIPTGIKNIVGTKKYTNVTQRPFMPASSRARKGIQNKPQTPPA